MALQDNVLILDDGTNYIIVDRVLLNNIDYVYLINKKNPKDILFQRISYETNPPKLDPIESEEEFNMVLNYFGKKYKNLLNQ
jgi:hypothetical protein